jgi:hypothetical protein
VFGMTRRPACLLAAATRPDYHHAGPATAWECQTKLAACLARGWLQVTDQPALAKINGELW